MKTNYFLFAIFLSFYSYAQVGINTTLPNAQLEIKSSNQATPAKTDGIIIPKIDAFPITNPTAAQQSMLVYLTTTSAGKLPGFYYWDNATTAWISVSGTKGWDLDGNSGTTASNFVGTTDAQDLNFKTNNVSKMRLTQKGQLVPLNTGNSVFIGEGAGLNDDLSANNNIFVGYQSGKTNTNGDGNCALGYQSLFSNTTGAYNIAIGYQALVLNTFGNGNIAFGNQSLFSNTSGNNNMAIGGGSLYSNSSGSFSLAIGEGALFSNTSGNNNMAIGRNSLYSNTTGTSNTALGLQSMVSNTTGIANTALGSSALVQNTTGGYNTALGSNSLAHNTTGSYNLTTGYFSAINLTIGDGNIVMGSLAGNTITTGSKNIVLGYNANPPSATTDNQMSIGNVIYGSTMSTTALGKIGIGQPNPTEKLDVAGNLKVSGALMPNNLAGTAGQVLTSAGAGVAPTWSSSSTQKYTTTGAATGIYSIPLSEYTIRVFNTVSEIQLPTAVGNQGKIFIIIGSNGIASKILSTLGGNVYDDVTNTNITTITTNQRFTVQSDGTDWIVIGR